MRALFAIALFVGACTAANPAFDPEQQGEPELDEPACTPGTPLELVTFGFEPEECSQPLVLAGMVITQDAGAFTMVECAGECPCDAEEPELALALHPEIPIPVFAECILVRTELTSDDCRAETITILGADEGLLVHAEHWTSPVNAAGLLVSESLVQECECDACGSATLAPGSYGLTFASPDDEVGPLFAGEMAEMTMLDGDAPTTLVVKALSTAIDCDCAPRRALQWSVTRN